jgi:hypothetical protein
MGYTQFYRKWFSGDTPVNAVKATATLTFTDVVVAAETVTIGDEVYEFVAASGDIAVATNIPVVVGTTLTADNAVTKLAEAINANSEIATATANTTADTCVITYKLVGTEGNSIGVAETCTNASFGVDVDALSGGQYATPAMTSCFIIIGGVWYIADAPVSKWDTDGWKSATPA